MRGKVCNAEVRQAALPRAQYLAGAAQAQVFLGDAEAVIGLAQDGQPRLGGFAQRPGIDQQAGAWPATTAAPAAQLVTRSGERRVGKECVRTGSTRGAPCP